MEENEIDHHMPTRVPPARLAWVQPPEAGWRLVLAQSRMLQGTHIESMACGAAHPLPTVMISFAMVWRSPESRLSPFQDHKWFVTHCMPWYNPRSFLKGEVRQ
jgi:hypothetical protein